MSVCISSSSSASAITHVCAEYVVPVILTYSKLPSHNKRSSPPIVSTLLPVQTHFTELAIINMATATATATTTTATTTAAYVRPRQNLVPKNEYASRFSRFIKSKPGLEGFYNDKALDGKVEKAKEMGDKLMEQGCGGEFAVPLSLLTLYDIVMLIGWSSSHAILSTMDRKPKCLKDDSHSMDYAQDGARKATLKKTIDEITKVYDLANDTGILSVRFINNKQGKKEVSNKKVESLFHERIYEGSTKIGTALEKKVLKPFVLSKEKMEKPLLVMTITDGTVSSGVNHFSRASANDITPRLRARK